MRHTTAFKPGWLREQIEASINQLELDPRIPDVHKEAFRIARSAVEKSDKLRRSGEAKSNYHGANSPSTAAKPVT